jgi:tetratricopeptide (TPR) repeat protein
MARSKSGDRSVRARALVTLSGGELITDLMEARRLAEMAVALDRRAPNALVGLAAIENSLGRNESFARLRREELALLRDPKAYPNLSPVPRKQYIDDDVRAEARRVGDFNQALLIDRRLAQNSLLGFGASYAADLTVIRELSSLHDIKEAQAMMARFQPENSLQEANGRSSSARLNMAAENWSQAWTDYLVSAKPAERRADKGVYNYESRVVGFRILINLGRFDEARAEIDPTPLDCAPCVSARAELAAAQGNKALADHWFREASRMTPSFALAPWRWGDALLKRGDPAAAIVQFQEAARRGPKWADPLEGWGEALLAQGDARGAAVKFAAAEKFAPNWGRLHLKWGEALARAGKHEEAAAQYQRAAALFLTPTERADLARLQGGR